MNPKLKLAPHALTHSLIGEMRQALECMEAGDYDGAFRILEGRCRPDDPATNLQPTFDADLKLRRVMVQMAKHIPGGLLRTRYMAAFQNSAMAIAQAFRTGDWIQSAENALCAANLAADFGVSLEWDYDPTPEEIKAELAALRGREQA